MKGRCRYPVFAPPGAGAAGKDLVVDICPLAPCGLSSQDHSSAARASGDSLLRDETAQGFENRLHDHMGGRHIGVDCRWKAGIEDAPVTEDRFHHAGQSLIDWKV